MHGSLVVVAILAGCGGDGPSCKDAVEQAAKTMYGTSANRDRTTMMIGTCEQDEWPAGMRQCVAGVTIETELAACFAKHKPPKQRRSSIAERDEPGAMREAVRRMEDFTTTLCACQDRACADRVQDAFTTWGTELAKTPDHAQPTPEVIKQTEAIMTRYTECLTKLMLVRTGAPELTAVAPATGDADGGTYVVLKGEGFTTGGTRSAKVYFGSRQGTVIRFQSDREIIVQASGGIAGERVDVRVLFEPGGEVVLANAFTFARP